MSHFDGHVRRLMSVPMKYIEALNRRLRDCCERDPHYWARHDEIKPNKFAVFEGSVQHIVLSFPVSLSTAREARTYPAWEEWKDVVQPAIDLVVPFFGYQAGQVNRIMFAKLRAGSEIGLHVDADVSAQLPNKIHIPISTNPKAKFWAEDKKYHLKVGGAYEVNNQVRHGGGNFGREDRVHLIFDYLDQSRLNEEEALRQARMAHAARISRAGVAAPQATRAQRPPSRK